MSRLTLRLCFHIRLVTGDTALVCQQHRSSCQLRRHSSPDTWKKIREFCSNLSHSAEIKGDDLGWEYNRKSPLRGRYINTQEDTSRRIAQLVQSRSKANITRVMRVQKYWTSGHPPQHLLDHLSKIRVYNIGEFWGKWDYSFPSTATGSFNKLQVQIHIADFISWNLFLYLQQLQHFQTCFMFGI